MDRQKGRGQNKNLPLDKRARRSIFCGQPKRRTDGKQNGSFRYCGFRSDKCTVASFRRSTFARRLALHVGWGCKILLSERDKRRAFILTASSKPKRYNFAK